MSLDYWIVSTKKCPSCGEVIETEREVFGGNLTHNLTEMASKAGIYNYLWCPEKVGITKARQLIEPLTNGLKKLKDNPEHFKKFNPDNGWGTYDGLVENVSKYIDGCKKYPEGIIKTWR